MVIYYYCFGYMPECLTLSGFLCEIVHSPHNQTCYEWLQEFTGDRLQEILAANPSLRTEATVIEVIEGLTCCNITGFDSLEELYVSEHSFRGELPERLFYNNKKLRVVSIPGATSVCDNCFHGCTSLTTVNLKGATVVKIYGFYECSSLTKISLPSLVEARRKAFRDCIQL